MKRISLTMLTVVFMLVCSMAAAEVVVLKDGSIITGAVTLQDDTVVVNNSAGTVEIDRSRVARIQTQSNVYGYAPEAGVPAAERGYYASPYPAYPGYPVAPAYPYQAVDAPVPYGYAAQIPAPVMANLQPTPYDQLLQVTAETANVRRGPGVQFAVLGQVNRDDVLYRVGHTDAWYNVITRSGQEGWVSAELVATMGGGLDNSPYLWDYEIAPADRIVTARVLNVRTGPGMSYAVIDQLYHHDVVKTIAQDGDWYRVRYLEPPSAIGWVHKDHVADIYSYVRGLIVNARYDEAAGIGLAALPALAELMNNQDWKVRYGAAMVRSKIIANQNLLSGVRSYNYEIFHR